VAVTVREGLIISQNYILIDTTLRVINGYEESMKLSGK
jgi:hypothetical protein